MALESRLLRVGDMQLLSRDVGTGEGAEDLYKGLVLEKERLLAEIAGDREREPQGGDTGDAVDDVWFGLEVGKDVTVEVFWLVNGDWHLDPQGGDTGDVADNVWFGLHFETVKTVEEFWLTTGD